MIKNQYRVLENQYSIWKKILQNFNIIIWYFYTPTRMYLILWLLTAGDGYLIFSILNQYKNINGNRLTLFNICWDEQPSQQESWFHAAAEAEEFSKVQVVPEIKGDVADLVHVVSTGCMTCYIYSFFCVMTHTSGSKSGAETVARGQSP